MSAHIHVSAKKGKREHSIFSNKKKLLEKKGNKKIDHDRGIEPDAISPSSRPQTTRLHQHNMTENYKNLITYPNIFCQQHQFL